MKTLTFKNGDKIPVLGLGTWKSEPGEVKKAVLAAIKAGYRHIDCAPVYGNESEVGEALTEAFDTGLVKREDMWITSKLWNSNHKEEQVIPALKKTLADLKLDYLDLYLIHWPVAFKAGVSFPEGSEDFYTLKEVPLTETWKGMEATVKAGLAKHIGVSNFNKERVHFLLENSKIAPEMNQVEMHPFLPQQELVDFCQLNKIHLTAYSPLGSGDRSEQMKKDNEPILFDHPVIKEIAEKHKASTAQVLISWQIHRDIVVIPKSTNEGRIQQNFESKDLALGEEDMSKIEGIDYEYRFVDGSFWAAGGSDYTQKALWG